MSTEKKSEYNRLSFQYFNQELDFGIENDKGECVRKRKRPGRKPNPPSLEERREQNRAAQKAFREREQRRILEKEKERKMYSDEIKYLRKKLAQTEYELKYLKGCLLHISLSSLVHKGCIPYIWRESRSRDSDKETKDSGYEENDQHIEEINRVPVMLDSILENSQIKDFDSAISSTIEHDAFTTFKKKFGQGINVSFETFLSHVENQPIAINQQSQEPRRNFPKNKKTKSKSKASTGISIEFQSKIDDVLKPSSSESYNSEEEQMLSETQILAVKQRPIWGVITEPPVLLTSDDFVSMPPLQALQILRLQLKLGSILGPLTKSSLIPTALQQVVPHDIRIDYVPAASIRDRMIMFQGYYDIDECFQYLTQKTVFTGGDVRDQRNWEVDPTYSNKFWFISHVLVEQVFDDCFNDEFINETYSSSGDNSDNEETSDKHSIMIDTVFTE